MLFNHKQRVVLPQTTCCLTTNDVLFYYKRRVVLPQTTCCFTTNDVLFCHKRRVVLPQTTCCFTTNDVLFYHKRRVVLLQTTCCFSENEYVFLGLLWHLWQQKKQKNCRMRACYARVYVCVARGEDRLGTIDSFCCVCVAKMWVSNLETPFYCRFFTLLPHIYLYRIGGEKIRQ